jgi:hypothetical protein
MSKAWQFRIRNRGFFSSLFLVTLPFCTTVPAGPITVPNGSFESPVTTFVNTHVDSWQKSAKPDWYDESGGNLWDQLTGTFKNTTNTSPDHIDNCDGSQAAWMFAVPEVALFQDYNTIDWSHTAPTHDFNSLYEAGKSYHLTVGIIGGGGNMSEGASLQLSLYYRDAASNMVAVAVVNVSNGPTMFSNTTHLVDFTVDVPAVKAGDPWAGQNMGIQILSTVSTNLEGGYWDLDNVRLSSIREPVLASPSLTNGQFNFTAQSESGLNIEILAATNLAAPTWLSLGTLSNTTGTISFVDPATNFSRRYYQARRIP